MSNKWRQVSSCYFDS